MRTILVVSRASDWPHDIPGVDIVLARDYLTNSSWTTERHVRVYNLCRSYRYQGEGYYVSLLAAARRHRPFPALMAVLNMKMRSAVRLLDSDLDALIERSLADIRSDEFVLSIYFRRNLAKRHDRLAARLFDEFPAPLLRATFRRTDRWHLASIKPIALRDVPDSHVEFMHAAARTHIERPRYGGRAKRTTVYDLAILHDPNEELSPSNPKALARFRDAAEDVGFAVEMIGRDDFSRLAEFDALLIRETTAVNHHTFRFAQKAESEGLVVIDDPQSILRCTNKVFQSEMFSVNKIPAPRTWLTHDLDPEEIERRIGYPCVLKVPDSAFSQGVLLCDGPDELAKHAALLEESDMVLVQEFLPSGFDWRIGVFDGKPLYACRYYMARGHWQIIKKTDTGRFRYGRSDTLPLEDAPPAVVSTAVRAAAAIGDGLYGVDLKDIDGRVVVIEVNDNPSIEAGCEDAVLEGELYRTILRGMFERVDGNRRGVSS